jgi:hypothetical protein
MWTRVRRTDAGLEPQVFVQNRIEDGDSEEERSDFVGPGTVVHRKNGKERRLSTPEGIQDVLTAIYTIRRMDLTVGETYRLPLLDGNDVETLVVPVEGRDRVGDRAVIRVTPYTVEDGEREQDGDWKLLLTDDARHIPVRMHLPLGFGTLRLRLTEATAPPGGDPRTMFCDPDTRMPH